MTRVSWRIEGRGLGTFPFEMYYAAKQARAEVGFPVLCSWDK